MRPWRVLAARTVKLRRLGMTLAELMAETLMQKHRRLQQEKCKHEEAFSSGVTSDRGSFGQKVCFECGKVWHYERPAGN